MKKIYVISAVLLLAALAIAGAQVFDELQYAKADIIKLTGTTLAIGTGCRAIIADTSPERAEAIQSGLEGRIIERPNVYDVYVQTLKSFNITIDRIALENYDGSYYYSNIFINNGQKILKIDSKPSDAVAVALRAKAPVYVKRDLLTKEGKNVC